MSRLNVGDKVKFREEGQRYTVQASDERYAVCTKPFNPRRTVLYSIIDFKEGIRGPENLVFGHGAETREQCEEMLDRLNGRELDGLTTEVSHRHQCSLNIERIDRQPAPPASKESL